MGVVVVRDVAHVVVDVVVEVEVLLDDHREASVEHLLHVRRGVGIVDLPHDHRDGADLALRDPAELVLVEPGGDVSGLAEVAVVAGHGSRRYRRRAASGPTGPLAVPTLAGDQSAVRSTVGGTSTASITWMTPFEAATSVATMAASPIFKVPPSSLMVTVEPSTVVTSPGATSAAMT